MVDQNPADVLGNNYSLRPPEIYQKCCHELTAADLLRYKPLFLLPASSAVFTSYEEEAEVCL